MAFGDNVVFGNVRRPTLTNVVNPQNRVNGGGFTQAGVGGVNLETGQPLGQIAYASGYPRPGGSPMYNESQPQQQSQPVDTRTATFAPSTNFAPATSISNSDAFFNGPSTMARRNVSVTPRATGGGSAGGGIDAGILKSIMDSFTASRSANEGRYNEAKGEVAKLGKVRENEIAGDFAQDTARMEQQAISRGLGNSSIREALLGGARTRQQNALTGLREAQAKTNIGLLQSREDSNVDPMQLVQLIQQAAASGGGGNALASIAKALRLS